MIHYPARARDRWRRDAEPEYDAVALEHADQVITWRETQHELDLTEPAVLVWSGEVHRHDGSGLAGPFGPEQAAAVSWALSRATAMPRGEFFGAQIVGYLCAESRLPELLTGGSCAFRRLNRFVVSPVQPRMVLPIDDRGRAVLQE